MPNLGLKPYHKDKNGYAYALSTAVKPEWNVHSQKGQKLFFNTNYRLMQVKSFAECSFGTILQ